MGPMEPDPFRLCTRVEDLPPVLWERLARRDAREAARVAGAPWDGRGFRLRVVGTPVLVLPRTRQVVHAADPCRSVRYPRALVAVAYLGRVADAPPAGRWVPLRDLPGGDAFFRGVRAVDTPRLAAAFGPRPGALAAAARALGGGPVEAPAEAVELPALPRVPVRVVLGAGPSAEILTDARALLHLPLEGLRALGGLVVSALVREAP